MSKKLNGPKILFLDIETAPILAYVWALWDQNIGLNMIENDWYILSWAAKWEHQKRVIYKDQSRCKVMENDKQLMVELWDLLDEADIVVTQNGVKFDHKKINARMIFHDLKPPSPYKTIDTLLIAKRKFAFTSNKLEYLSSKLNKKYTKLTSKDREFVGFELWKACLNGNMRAWAEMKRYNKLDVLTLEELFYKLIPWHDVINRSTYVSGIVKMCNSCGSSKVKKNGHIFTSRCKYQKYKCSDCGFTMRDNKNKLTPDKRKSIYYPAK